MSISHLGSWSFSSTVLALGRKIWLSDLHQSNQKAFASCIWIENPKVQGLRSPSMEMGDVVSQRLGGARVLCLVFA